jgi:dinuclear metal center YbgI/SA1388 family protein
VTNPAAVPAPTVADVIAALDERYPPAWAEEWDRVGLVVGDPSVPVDTVLCVVDCVPETVAQAVKVGAQMVVAHHPLLLRGVSSVAATTYKGRLIRDLIKRDMALFVAHTNADVADPGVSGALAELLALRRPRPLRPAPEDPTRGIGRIGELPAPMTLAELTGYVADALPATAWGVRAAGDPDRRIETLAVCGGAGDSFLADAAAAGVDAYLTSDLRHHPAGEAVAGGGPALLDAAHWATERPWLDELAGYLRMSLGVTAVVSDMDTDPWTVHANTSRGQTTTGEQK